MTGLSRFRRGGFAVWLALVGIGASAQTITTTATFNNLGVHVQFTTAAPEAVVRVFLKEAAADGDFREVHPLSRLDATNCAGSVFGLVAGTTYVLKLTSVALGADRLLTVATRSDVVPEATNRLYHVSVAAGDDSHDGASVDQAFRTLGKALATAGPGDKVLLHDGTYYEGDLAPARSGTAAAPIVIENAPGARPELNGLDPDFVPVWSLFDPTNRVYRTPCASTPENAYLNGVQFFHYISLDDLRSLRWSQPGGYAVDGSFLYARFPQDAAPGTNLVTIPAHTTGITLAQKSHVQVRGLEFCYFGKGTYHRGLYIDGGSSNWVDRCFFHHNGVGVALKRAADFNTIQHCTFTESPLAAWSWHAVKEGGIGYEAGGVVVYGSSQPNRGNVIRYCTFTNLFDGAHLYSEDPAGPTENLDFHSNWLEGCGDDGIETDGVGSNCRIYFNRFQSFLTGVSVAPCARGPTYLFRNLLAGWRPAAEFDGYPFKFNVSSALPIEWVYLYHNTCVTDTPDQDGFLFKQYSNWTNVVSRNNSFAGTRYALESWSAENPVDFDFDNLYTTDPSRVIAWAGARYDTVASFALATGQERHGRSVVPGFVNPPSGDYYLRSDSGLIDQGVVIPGVNDDYLGGAPDLGVFEFGMQARAISVRDDRLQMDWRVGAPLTGQLEYATNLYQSAWQSLGGPVRAERSLVRLNDASPAGSQRFYRLRRVAPWSPLQE